MIRFCHNHGLIQITDRPQWWTVRRPPLCRKSSNRRQAPEQPGQAISRDALGVNITTARHRAFDKVIVATHSDQALALLQVPSAPNKRCWAPSATTQPRRAAHRHVGVAQRQLAWAAWN
jgi:predicted NAD/FAD-binding protein